ncbi:hypothetical protein GWI68_07730 [Proteus sp. G2669]|uniref:hypothetical protein n=1 Tax=Proteus sp. G2669 TaxID=2698881 RepID=UPI001411CD35|nr:hypothetical protein [Proteus sp. G2669]NBM54680.1 hypothetical protein [Proteus sp. G2669]
MSIIDSVRTSFSQIKATIDNLDLKNKIMDFFYYIGSSITGLFNNNVEYRHPVIARHIRNDSFNAPKHSTYEMLRESALNIQNEKKLAINNEFNKDEPIYEEVNNIFIDNGVRDKKTSDTTTQSEKNKEHIYATIDFKRKRSYLDKIINNEFNKDEPIYEEVNNIFIDNGVRDKKTSDTTTQSEKNKEHIYATIDFKRKRSYLDKIINQAIDEIKTNFSSIK